MRFKIVSDNDLCWSGGEFKTGTPDIIPGGFGNENAMIAWKQAKEKCGNTRIRLCEIDANGRIISTVCTWNEGKQP